jgi:phosphoribosylpyrophosphate synthetase
LRITDESPIRKLFITDTIEHHDLSHPKIEVVSVGDLIGDAILRIETGESLSELFETD